MAKKEKRSSTLKEVNSGAVITNIVMFSVFALLLALYFTGWVACFMAHIRSEYWLPQNIWTAFKIVGFPASIFMIIFAVLEALALYLVYQWYRLAADSDVMGRKFRHSHNSEAYGGAHFAEPCEYENYALVQKEPVSYGMIIGQLDNTGKRVVNYRMGENRTNRHTVVIGASGTGKTYCFTKPFILQAVKRRESILVTDPDMGLYRDMSEYLIDKGYRVRWLNLNDLERSDSWNPLLDALHGGQTETMVAILASTIVYNTMGKNVTDAHISTGIMLLKAMILLVIFDPNLEDEKKTLSYVYDKFTNAARTGGPDALRDMFKDEHIHQSQRPAANAFATFEATSPNFGGNILTSLMAALGILSDKGIREITGSKRATMSVRDLGEEPCVYFCAFPDTHSSFQFMVAMFFSIASQQLIYEADHSLTGKCKVPVNFLLDEAAAIGAIPEFDRLISTSRKRDLHSITIFQNFSQFENLYGLASNDIFVNSGTKIIIGTNDLKTSETVSEYLGEITVRVDSDKKGSESLLRKAEGNTGKGKRMLMTASEINRMSMDDEIVITQGKSPIWLKKYGYTLHSEAPIMDSKRKAINDIPKITTPEREAYNKDRDERARKYYETHPDANNIDRSYPWITGGHWNDPDWRPKKKKQKDTSKKAGRIETAEKMKSKKAKKKAEKETFRKVQSCEVPYETMLREVRAVFPEYTPLPKFDTVTGEKIEYAEDYQTLEERRCEKAYLKNVSKENQQKLKESLYRERVKTEKAVETAQAKADADKQEELRKQMAENTAAMQNQMNRQKGVKGSPQTSIPDKKPNVAPEAEERQEQEKERERQEQEKEREKQEQERERQAQEQERKKQEHERIRQAQEQERKRQEQDRKKQEQKQREEKTAEAKSVQSPVQTNNQQRAQNKDNAQSPLEPVTNQFRQQNETRKAKDRSFRAQWKPPTIKNKGDKRV